MTLSDFKQNATTGFWEATATVNSTADLALTLPTDAAGKYNRHVTLKWKGATADPNYAIVEGSTRVPVDGNYNQQITSEFYPVYIQVECGAKPTYCRLTEH